MTTGNLSALIGGGGVYTSNPKDLPLIIVDTVHQKTATSVTENSGNAAFFTNMALRGASGAITVADTYVTLCDLTGSGLLCNVVGPTHSTTYAATFKITVDGTVHTFSVAGISSASPIKRLMLGTYTNGYSTNTAGAVGYDTFGAPSGQGDWGFATAQIGGVPEVLNYNGARVALPTPEAAMAYGLPLLRFKSSLKVEVKASLLSATAVHKQCGVTYRLDI